MNVFDLMTREVRTCASDDYLSVPAQIMWEKDCGCVPVVDEERRVVGMITDRDICMAAYTQGGPIEKLRVASAMAARVHACRPEDPIAEAESLMAAHQVRRLPVVDEHGRLAGIISLNDIACEAARERGERTKKVKFEDVAETLAVVCQHHVARR